MDKPAGLLARLINRVFPPAPDFYRLINDQCELVCVATALFVRYMETGEASLAAHVKQIEHEADAIKARNFRALGEAFSTPFDREDLYRAIYNLDQLVNYLKTTIYEMEVLAIPPDGFTVRMAKEMHAGAEALRRGFRCLGTAAPSDADAEAQYARKAERRVERLYREGLAELFQGTDYLNMFKRRELYRHLSNAADHLVRGANTLQDIVVKIT